MTFTKRITTAIATGAVLANALAPVALAQSITVTGNGAFSDSAVNVSNNSNTSVNQTNNANITNKVSSNASTGGNSANYNTGGDTLVKSGAASSTTVVDNAANLNVASLPSCGNCAGGASNVTVSGNGAYSDNGVALSNDKTVSLNQDNSANIKNYIDANAKTGGNDSKFNTGGDNLVQSGAATTAVGVTNKANANFATLGGGNGSAGSATVTIDGNGAFSDNLVGLSGNSAVVLDQDNNANIKNVVDANASTGYNDGKFNTGGTTGVVSGPANTLAVVDNAVNFNYASVDCGCVFGNLGVLINENGAMSLNEVYADMDHALLFGQDNVAALYNNVDGNAKTGGNDSKFGTAGDTLVQAGAANSETGVYNSGNVNMLNNGNSLNLPGDWEMDFDFDLSDLWLSFNHMFMV